MKDLLQFVALGLNGLLLIALMILATIATVQEMNAGNIGGTPGIILLIAMAPASALMALGVWRQPKAA